MTAQFIIADVFDGLATLEAGSVDLIVTSPPFLALRSYLPADHPDKHRELGSEATPAEFIDMLLRWTAACDRVLAPHGSLCVELGDTYAGSSGGGEVDGFNPGRNDGERYQRDGLPSIPARAHADGLRTKGAGWPLAKSKTLIPELYRIALAYGINPLTGQESPAGRWRIRNVVTWARPNPPVGALGDKWRPATSDVVVACRSGKRYWDDLATRRPHTDHSLRYYTAEAEYLKPLQADESRHAAKGKTPLRADGGFMQSAPVNHHGAPLLDYWVIPPGGYNGAHYAVFPPELVTPLIQAMCPFKVCTRCGLALGLERGSNGLQGMRTTGWERVGEDVLLPDMSESPHGAQPGINQGVRPVGEGIHPDQSAGSSDGKPGGVRDGASPSNGRAPGSDAGIVGGRPSQERGEGRQQDRESGAADQDGTRPASEATTQTAPLPSLRRVDSHVSQCPACGGELRNGTVLDPFAGSGTTLVVASGHGHDAIGIDLDERNYDLALARVGPLVLGPAERLERV